MEFAGRNIRLLRTFKGMSVRALADEVSASESTVSAVERGREPTESLKEALAIVLGVDHSFFWVPVRDEFTEDNCNFRKGHSSAEKIRKRVLAQATLFAHVVRTVSIDIRLPPHNVPTIPVSTDEEIESAADACRELWGLGLDRPINSMGRALENAGVMLARLRADESAQLDAFSRFQVENGPSYVVLNPAKGSTSRVRFDMAHELGHLVCHSHERPEYKERERQADRFASAFLLPRIGFVREFPSHGRVSWASVFELKRRWRVSVQAIIYRAKTLGLIDAVEFRRAFSYLSSKGWRRNEPEEPEAEGPELFRRAMSALWETKHIGAAELSSKLKWQISTFEDVTGLRAASRSAVVGPHSLDHKVISLASHRVRGADSG